LAAKKAGKKGESVIKQVIKREREGAEGGGKVRRKTARKEEGESVQK